MESFNASSLQNNTITNLTQTNIEFTQALNLLI